MKATRTGVRAALAPALLVALSGCAVRPAVAPVAPEATAAPTAAPTATPTPPALTPAPVQVQVPARDDVRPPVVRILLQAPAGPLFPEPGRRYVCVAPDAVAVIRGPLTATLVPGRVAIQVGAFAREDNARAALVRVNAAGFEGRIDARGEGPRRVVALGRDGEGEDGLALRLAKSGFSEQRRVAVAYGGGIVLGGEDGASLSAPSLRLVPVDPEPVRVGAKSVRGEFELRPGASGVVVINVVNLEQYLRGVVPAEMGPRAFPSLEALKAQAVAARTYAFSHLGDHSAEGYDLCDSQACQVYEGVGVEHPLTDRAVAETAAEVATWQGRPIDAMYHSTCAGHTEDAGALFPDRAQPYLKGVPCRGEATLALGTGAAAGPWLGPLEHLVAIGETLAAALGGPRDARSLAAHLTGKTVGAGSAALVHAFGLDATAAALHVAPVAGDDATMELLRTFRLALPPPERGEGRRAWELALAVRLGQLAGKVQAIPGRLVPGPTGNRLVTDGSDAPRDLGGREAVLVKRGERWRRGAASVASGSPATLWCANGVCPVLEVDPMEAADAGSAWTWWARELTLAEVGKRLGLADVRDVRVLRRGASGRALAVAVVTATGVKDFPGMAFRRALDLPDTLFVAVRAGAASSPTLRFLGRGWGHGVGMCQNGAYGLARGGESYVQILQTYYTGVEVGQWKGWTP